MVHTFTARGAHYAYDVESGALNMVDGLALRLIGALSEGKDAGAAAAALSGAYPPDVVDETLDEIEALKRAGALFAPDNILPLLEARGHAPLKALCLHVSHDCQLRCRYCFAGTGAFSGARALMSAKTGMDALRMLIERSGERTSLETDFFGGEPLLNMDVVRALVSEGRALARAHGKEFHFTLTTNCVALDERSIEFINAEMDNVVLSIDGRASTHDAMRPHASGAGSYHSALKNAQRLVSGRGGKSYYVRGTFTAANLDFASDVLALADAGFEHISVEPVVLPPASPLAIREEHLPRIAAEYERLLDAVIVRRNEGRPFNFFHFLIDTDNGPCLAKRVMGCGAGVDYLAVTPEGDLYPCHQFVGDTAFTLGSVRDGALDDALRARFAANTVAAKPACASCWAKYHCTGGCAANAQHYSGRIDTPNPVECAMQKKRLECALALCAEEPGRTQVSDD